MELNTFREQANSLPMHINDLCELSGSRGF